VYYSSEPSFNKCRVSETVFYDQEAKIKGRVMWKYTYSEGESKRQEE